MLTIVFIKSFGMYVAVDNIANNFIDSLTLVGQYDIHKNLILIFTVFGGIMGALGSIIVLNANSIYNTNKNYSKIFKISKYTQHLPK